MASPIRLDDYPNRALATPENQVFVSSVTVWEIAIERAIGRLVFPIDWFDDVARRQGSDMLAIYPAHAVVAGSRPRHHEEPFDRTLIGQATVENLTLVTSDPIMSRYNARILGPDRL